MGSKPEISAAGRKAIAVAEGHLAEAKRRLNAREADYRQAICDAWGLEPGKRVTAGDVVYVLANDPLPDRFYHGHVGPSALMGHKLKKDGTPSMSVSRIYGLWEWAE